MCKKRCARYPFSSALSKQLVTICNGWWASNMCVMLEIDSSVV